MSSDGYETLTAKGICYSETEPIPTIGNSVLAEAENKKTGSYQIEIEGLKSNTLYYVRAYATNIKGTGYGEVIQVQTTSGPLATLTLTSATSNELSANEILFSANITSKGGTDIIERGVVYDTKASPELPKTGSTSKKLTFGAGDGVYDGTIGGLAANTQYFIRAYAINEAGVGYSDEKSLFTNGKPVLSNTIYYDLTGALLKGVLETQGGLSITEQGFVWGTMALPSLTNNANKINVTPGVKNFNELIPEDSMIIGKQYYVRAFATNSLGTSYGDVKKFYYIPIGAQYKGGIVFWIDPAEENGNKGMIVTEFDLPDSTTWGCLGDSIPTSGSAKTNTDIIISRCSETGIAARACRSHITTQGGTNFNTFDLPTIDDLKRMDESLHRKGLGGFNSPNGYWSSNQASESRAYTFKFSTNNSVVGQTLLTKKNVKIRMRGVKTF